MYATNADFDMIENRAPNVEMILLLTVGIPPIRAALSEFMILWAAFSIKPLFCSEGKDVVISLNFKERVRAEGFLLVPAGSRITLKNQNTVF